MQQAANIESQSLNPWPSSKPNKGKEFALRKKLRNDRAFYAEKILRIRPKQGKVIPFIFNDVQKYIDYLLDEQKRKTGKVRAIIVKGRQQGCSTYIAARFYHLTTHLEGVRTFILTHDTKATSNLFEMVMRYYEHTPEAIKPILGTSNQRELSFPELDSGYHVGTAGSRGTGRSNTIQLFHGSEVAFWPHADEHAAGALQAVPDSAGTEVILESTANGMGNFFHRQWCKAVAGKGEFMPIFIPWYWQKEYVKDPGENFCLDAEEQEYKAAHKLTMPQMAWRRAKMESLGDPDLFKQEYPGTAEEAFQFSGIESFISAKTIMKARQTPADRSVGPIVAGFDPSRDGADRDAIIYRQGRTAFNLEYKDFRTFPERVAFCKQVLDRRDIHIHTLFIDYGGSGWEIAGMLDQDGYGSRVRLVNSGTSSDKSHLYVNKRAEMWGEMKAWFEDASLPVTIPDDNALHADLAAPGFKYDSNTRIQIESKKEIKKRELISPDGADALALTFAFPIYYVVGGGETFTSRSVADTNYDIFGGL